MFLTHCISWGRGLSRGLLWSLLGSLSLCLLAPPHMIEACTCLPESPVPESVDRADAVFRGVAVEVEELTPWDNRATFVVTAIWKGEISETLQVQSFGPGLCGYFFQEGGDYIVYAYEDSSGLATTHSSRTRFYEVEEEEALGDPIWRNPDGEGFIRGDVIGDGKIDLADAIALIGRLFPAILIVEPGPPPCLDSGDVDDDGMLTTADAISLLLFQFRNGPAPAAPFPSCGSDLTPDGLPCLVGTPVCRL